MPLFEYKCPQCNEKQELVMSYKAQDPICILCYECGQYVRMERQISVPAPAQFKGPGFYSTDYKKKT